MHRQRFHKRHRIMTLVAGLFLMMMASVAIIPFLLRSSSPSQSSPAAQSFPTSQNSRTGTCYGCSPWTFSTPTPQTTPTTAGAETSLVNGSEEESEQDSDDLVLASIASTPTPTPQSASKEWRPYRLPGESIYAMTSYVARADGDSLLLLSYPYNNQMGEEISILPDAKVETTNDQGKIVSFPKENIGAGMLILYYRTTYGNSPLYTRYIWVYPRF